MKYLGGLLAILTLCFPALLVAEQINSNHPLYTLESIVAYEISPAGEVLFSIEEGDSGRMFVRRELASGETVWEVPLDLPPSYFLNTVILDQSVYVFSVEVLDRQKRLIETSIFQLSCQDGSSDLVYQSRELKGFAEKFYATGNGLLLTEKRGNNPFLFNLDTHEMTAIDLPEDYRIVSFDIERNSAVIIEQNNFDTSSTDKAGRLTYTEGDGNPLDVYICDFNRDYALKRVGRYQPSYVRSQQADESSLPFFSIDNSDDDWVPESFMVHRFPLHPEGLIGDPQRYGAVQSLVGHEWLTSLTMAADKYVVAQRFFDGAEKKLVVYDLKNPRLARAETVSKEDREKIKALLGGQTAIEKRVLDPEAWQGILDARFFEVSLVTTTIDSSEGGISSFSFSESFLAVAQDTNYSVFKQIDQLKTYLEDDFRLTSASAGSFQDVLDELFPLGTFAEKHKAYFQKAQQWFFVRDESFGELKGIVVDVDSEGKILSLQAKKEITP